MSKESMAKPHSDFVQSVGQVYKLMNFDHIIQDHLLGMLEPIYEAQQKFGGLGPKLKVDGPYKSLKNIRGNDSLRPRYEEMFNQCLVLLVSHFTSAVRALFNASVAELLSTKQLPKSLRREELKLTVEQTINLSADPEAWLASLLIARDKLTFQDMGSTLRAFKEYCGATVERGDEMNDIIAAQAYRHVIVHNSGIIDGKCLAQLRDALPRTLKPHPVADESVVFMPLEIEQAGEAMRLFLLRLTNSAYVHAHPKQPAPVDNPA